MGTIVLTGATSGSTTIQPTDAVTAVLTLPSTTGTLAVSGGSPSFLPPPMVNVLAHPIGGLSSLRAIDVTESIGMFMKVALLGGVALALLLTQWLLPVLLEKWPLERK